MAKIRDLDGTGVRLGRTHGLVVEFLKVERPVPSSTLFVVTAKINGYNLTFNITPETCLVWGVSCHCQDFLNNFSLCKHILRALLEIAGLLPPPPPMPAVGKAALSPSRPGGGSPTQHGRARAAPMPHHLPRARSLTPAIPWSSTPSASISSSLWTATSRTVSSTSSSKASVGRRPPWGRAAWKTWRRTTLPLRSKICSMARGLRMKTCSIRCSSFSIISGSPSNLSPPLLRARVM
mmetsp:Transcript_25113/g.61961  ORF Transcript_25113/g.61961 Transcript_25113/m.61961 type:complete len:236 (-) Transcript_25113:2222-2929(-)